MISYIREFQKYYVIKNARTAKVHFNLKTFFSILTHILLKTKNYKFNQCKLEINSL